MIERLYTDETETELLERKLARVDDALDKRQGSIIYDATAANSFETAQAYVALDDVIQFGLNVTSDSPDEFVDLKTQWVGISRIPSINSTGTLTFQGEDGTVIDVGTRARTNEPTPVYFTTTEEGTIVSGQVTVLAIADEGGVSGNVNAGTIVISLGDLTGVTAVTNDVDFVGGVDEETNQSLLDRYYEKVRKPATSGNVYQYEQWAKEVPGVGDVKVYPVWNGAGTVKLVLLDDEKKTPDASIITATQTFVESVRPIGADVTYVGASELAINVSATLTLAPGVSLSEVQAQFERGVSEYLKSIAFVTNEITQEPELIRYTRIANVLLDIPPIIDYVDLLVNGGTSNIQPTDEQVGVVGTVSFI